jgi:hypothetical protein
VWGTEKPRHAAHILMIKAFPGAGDGDLCAHTTGEGENVSQASKARKRAIRRAQKIKRGQRRPRDLTVYELRELLTGKRGRSEGN